jgi:NAD(P)-dependent dehydrogenase (short-subunit alcohol dehydrogenase family)
MAGVVVVTGGGRGIGRAVSLGAARRGYAVVVNYAGNAEAAASVVDAIRAAGGIAKAVQGDVANEADVLRLFEAADRLGPLTALVNNAGILTQKGRVDETNVDQLRRAFDVNVIGSFLCAREAIRRLSTRHGGKGGSIINLTSVAALLGAPGKNVDYAASKGAIDSFTTGLAREVADEMIRVNAIRPGIIDTEIHLSGGDPGRVAEMRAQIPMKREGSAEEVANAVLWLLSDEASYVTGATIAVTGGR